MAEQLSDPVFDRFLKRFEADVMEKVHAELLSGRLHDEGRVRSNIRKDLQSIFNNTLEFHDQMKLVIFCGKQLLEAGEFPLARECFQEICDAATATPDNLDLFRITIEARQSIISCDYTDITLPGNFSIAPMRVSRLLGCLASARDVLDTLLSLPDKDQEHFAWLVLNGCKLIYTIGHPLLWLDCAKYVHESFIFASLCMDAVINLCTTRHLNFRMKICSSAFSSLVTHSSHEEVYSFVQYVRRAVAQLRVREELDPPLERGIAQELMRAETDLAVMEAVMQFWQLPDSLDLAALQNPFPDISLSAAPNAAAAFAEKCLMECIRTQELTASNTNEPWKKRSSALLKAFMAYSEQFLETAEEHADTQEDGSPEGKEEEETERETEEKENEEAMTVECLVSVLSLAMFDELEGINNEDVLDRINLLHLRCLKSPGSDLSKSDFSLLKALTLYIASSSNDNSPAAALHLVETIHDMIHSDRFAVRKTLLRKLALGVWSKAVYPALQNTLSSVMSAEFPSGDLVAMLSPVNTAAVSLVFSGIEDPVLLGSVSVIVGQLLHFVGDSRRCLSFLATAVQCIDDHRAARVDLQLHYPDDVSDLKALQHASFTCRADNSYQWHASAKRLGAHAFAGFGIFGTASSMASVDQALCDLHMDLLALLFRCELSYAIGCRSKNTLLKTSLAPQDAKAKAKAAELASSLAATTASALCPNVDKLACISFLRASWGKSTYARSILLVEMARVEKRQDKKVEYLQEAVECVQEAERREVDLQTGFADLTVVSASAARHPVVIARSHSFFYVAPVGCRKQGLDKVEHFRVFGREEGSGTDISVTSDELGGCDVLVKASDLHCPTASAVRISSIRAGEKYAFASAGYGKDGNLVGHVSPTCQSIEATNPLPIISLRANICLLAFEIGEYNLSNRLSVKVCDYYMKLSRPKQENRSFAKGINVFSYDRYFFNMLSVQQASPVQLVSFVKCFLAAQSQYVDTVSRDPLVDSTTVDIFEVQVHWNFKASEQHHIATNCHRLAMVSTVASMCQDHELIVRCVCLGYSLISQSLLFDISQMAQVLLNPILVFLSALKVTPKADWQSLDHQLYCRLLLCAIKCAVVNGNTSSLSSVLADLYSSEGGEGEEKASDLPLSEYSKLLATIKTKASLFATPDVVQQMNDLLSLQDYSDENIEILNENTLWNLPETARAHLIRNSALALAQGGDGGLVLKIREHLREPPPSCSQLVDMLLCSAMQLQAEGKCALVQTFLSTHPVRKDYLAVSVSEECAQWGVDFVCEVPAVEEEEPQETNDETEVDYAAPTEVNNHLLTPPVSEVLDQFRGIAHLCAIQADAGFAADMFRNDFPESEDGPYLQLSHESLEAGLEELLPKDGSDELADTLVENNDGDGEGGGSGEGAEEEQVAVVEEVNVRVSYVKRLATATIFFVRAKYFQSAVDTVLKMWKFVTDQWLAPLRFASEFSSLKSHLLALSGALVQLLEAQCVAAAEEGEGEAEGEKDFPNAYHPRTVKQNLFVLRFPVTFFLKTLCLFGLSKEVVEIGLRVLDVYVHHGAEYSNVVCDHLSSYMLFAQDKIISKNTETVNSRERKLNKYISSWEEMQAKKRKKKMRVVKVEKSDDELKFETEKASLNDKLDRSRATLEFSRQKKDFIIQIEKRVDGANTSGQQLFDRVRKSSTSFIGECRGLMRDSPEQYPAFSSILRSKPELKKFNDIIGHYDQVVMFLREKKDTANLVSCLHEEGDFYLLFGRVDMSRDVWRDGVDGFFNVLDAWKDWQDVADAAVQNVNLKTAGCVLSTITMLSKLSKHCSMNDMDLKSNYCQLAAKLCLIPFKETLNHPVDLHGFAAYNCTELGGKDSFEFDNDTFSSFSFHNGLEEILKVLGGERLHLVSLPLLVLWEHFHGAYTRRPDQWLTARLRRIQFLVELHCFSEATSMLSSIVPALRAVQSGDFTGFLAKACTPKHAGAEASAVMSQEVSSNGFEFPDCPPFYCNQTIGGEMNQLSIAWIAAFPELFATVAEEFKVILPPASTNDSPHLEDVEEMVVDEKQKGKGKGKKADEPVVEEEVVKKVNSRPLFSSMHHCEVYVSCALFLTELSSLDGRVTAEHHDSLRAALGQAETLLGAASSLLQPEEEEGAAAADGASQSWNNAPWVCLFGKCRLLHLRQLCLMREYKACRSNSLDLLKQLNIVSNVFCNARFELTHLWLSTKLALAQAAECQARFGDVLKISKQGSGEASLISSSYWCRRFVYFTALGHFKQGDTLSAEEHCARVSASYQHSKLCDLGSVRCKLLSVSIVHAKLQNADTFATIQQLGAECISALRSAVADSERLSVQRGFVGSDSNLTFESPTSSLMKHDRYTPFVNGITSLHVNYPDMTPALPSGGARAGKALSNAPAPDAIFSNTTLRAGPIDVADTYTESHLCNIYLEEVKLLALCSTTLCMLLDELGGAHVFSGGGGVHDDSFSDAELLKEQIHTGEAGLKILRHVAYPSTFIKTSLFLSVGKTRIKETSAQCLDGRFPGCEDFLPPLVAGLQVSMAGPHQWHTMKMYCLEIVECYGNQSLFMEVDSPTRLKMAVKYLLLCARLDNIQFDVEYNALRLLEEAALVDAVCPEEAERLLVAMTSSSLFSFGKSKESDQAASSGGAAKGKGKDDQKPAACQPGARDAFLLLSALAREHNPFLMDGVEYTFLYDLLRSVRKAFPQIEDKLFVSELPHPDEELVVTEASVTCVWASVCAEKGAGKNKAAGLFPRLTGYILLGGLKEMSSGTESVEDSSPSFVSEEPYLRKVNLETSVLTTMKKKMILILNRMVALEAANPEAAYEDDDLAQLFCDTLRSFLFALQGIAADDDKACEGVSVVVSKPTEESPTYGAAVSLNGAKICDLSMKSTVMQQLIDVVAQDKACYNLLCERDVCLFFWGALRF
jgi:hypothetical protein